MKKKTTRRDFIKTTALGAGLLIGFRPVIYGQDNRQQGRTPRDPVSISLDNPSIQIHRDRCRKCGRCVDFCRNTTAVFEQTVPPGENACIHCGQCSLFCQVITEQYNYKEVINAISDPDKIVVATTAPAIRVALGEMYGLEPGTNVEEQIIGSLKQLGVEHILDTTFSADLAVMEEATELIRRLESGNFEKAEKLSMFTSCCPAWVRYVKMFYPAFLPNLSTVKSPVLMQGALVKTYFAQKHGINPEKIVHVAFTPCTAKKGEILLEGMNSAGASQNKPEMRDVDVALTCRELANLFNEGKVDFLQAQRASYSSLMGRGSGSGLIFGNTGGVMEASLRTAYKLLNDKNPPDEFYELHPVRGFDNLRQASVDLGKCKLNVAVVHGIRNVKSLIEAIQSNEQSFDFVEVMACPGGCIGGGGQPYTSTSDAVSIKQLRLNGLYQQDTQQEIRLSCDNPEIKAIYSEFLGKPLGKKSEELLRVDRVVN